MSAGRHRALAASIRELGTAAGRPSCRSFRGGLRPSGDVIALLTPSLNCGRQRSGPTVMRSNSGFTLIEVMITVAIIAILAAIAYPSYQNYVVRGKRTAAKAAMMDLANREQQYLLANRLYADTAALTANGYAVTGDIAQNYSWAVTVTNSATPPNFKIIFTPIGSQASDEELTLNSQGTKTPAAKWER